MPYIGTSPSNGVRRVHTYTATASQTTFTGASSEGVTLSYADTNYIDVFQNGVLLGSADYTSTSGTSVVLAQGASADDLIVIVVYDVFSVADTVSKTNGGSFDSAVTMSDNLTVSGAFTSQGIDDNADATAITIDSSENVGIGNTSPDAKLDVHGNVEFGDGGGFDMNINGTRHQFSIGGNEYMRLNNDGDLFLGTSTANSAGKFEIEFNGTGRNGIVLKTTRTATGTDFIKFFNSGGTQAGEINHNGSTTVLYTASSDYRLKENVSYNFDATTRLKNLKPCRFNFIADGTDRIVDGFLAHEVSSIVPEAITGEKDAVDADGNIDPQGIDQSKLVPLLTKALQEQQATIEALTARITALEKGE